MSEKERLLLTKSISGYFVSSVKENEKWGNIEQQYRISEEIYEDIEQLQQENQKYKEVIDKAIEYLKKWGNEPDADMYQRINEYKEYSELLDILKEEE